MCMFKLAPLLLPAGGYLSGVVVLIDLLHQFNGYDSRNTMNISLLHAK